MIRLTLPEFVAIWTRRQGLSVPQVHDRIVRWLEARWLAGDRRMLLQAFRGCGKSTLVGLFAAWLLVGNPNLRLLVLAADLALGRKMVRTVKRLLERHPFARGLKPAHLDQWAADRFTVARPMELRDPSMLACGIDSNMTGSRADVVICDDVEVPKTCDTAAKRSELRAKLSEIDYVLVPGGTQLYIGTPHTYYSLYAESPRRDVGETSIFLDGFARLTVPVLTMDGGSAWPERFSMERIERMRRHTGMNKFASQMLLQPVNMTLSRLDPERLRRYDGSLEYREAQGVARLSLNGERLVSASCFWDPAYGARAPGGAVGRDGGDGSVVAAVFSDRHGNHYLHRILYIEPQPDRTTGSGMPGAGDDDATRQCRRVAAFAESLHLPAVTLEINGLGRFLPGLLRRALAQAGTACAVVETNTHTNKQVRILEAFDTVLAAGALFAHVSVWDTPFIEEMRDWRPDARFKGHDDGLDAVAGCLKAEPVRLGRLPRPARLPDWRPGTPVVAPTE